MLPKTQEIRLIRLCKTIERHTVGVPWQSLYARFAPAYMNLSALDKHFDLEWGGSLTMGQPRTQGVTVARALWEILYPELLPKVIRFQYAKPTINPWNARPSMKADLPLELRVEQDRWFAQAYQLQLEEPNLVTDQPFELVWDD